jgi:hypothetical protein
MMVSTRLAHAPLLAIRERLLRFRQGEVPEKCVLAFCGLLLARQLTKASSPESTESNYSDV